MKHFNSRRGMGILIATVSMTVVALMGAMYTAAYRTGVAGEAQNYGEGRRALELSRSALAEALAEFADSVNRPGTAWYDALRNHPTSREGMRWWLVDHALVPLSSQLAAAEGTALGQVRVSVWRDFAIAPETGPYDEKYALLTLTADAVHKTAGSAPFRGKIRRQLQRSYHVKQVRVVPAAPFQRWTLYVHRAPQLETQKQAYEDVIKRFAARRREIVSKYNTEIDDVVRGLGVYLTWMAKKVADWNKAYEEIKKAKEEHKKLVAIAPLTLGLAVPQAIQLGKIIEKMEADLADDIKKTCAAFNLPDEQTFRSVASNPYPPPQLKADIAFAISPGTWPAFRRWTASPEGYTGAGDRLDMPLVVERERVTSREIDYNMPISPDLPRRPTYSMATAQIAWLDRYGPITAEFKRYISEYDAALAAYLASTAGEFDRHESLFRLLPAVPDEYGQQLVNLNYQSRRATHIFPDQTAFLKHVVGPDGVAHLSGAYAVRGDLTQFPRRYSGHGHVCVEGQIRLEDVQRASPDATLAVLSGRDTVLTGSSDVAVAAPAGRVKAQSVEQTVGHAIVAGIAREDDFTVVRRPELVEPGPAGLWVTVAPAPLGEALLRQ